MRLFAILFLCCFAFHAVAEDLTGDMQIIELDGKKIYYWSPQTQRKAPLVVFSHAFTDCAENIKYLARALAEDGFWVAAVIHKDSTCGNKKAAQMKPAVPFAEPDKWNDTTYSDRKDDINGLLETMVKDKNFLKYIDFEHVGLAGYSLGGYVAMGMGGAWDSWKTHDIKAILALSPHNTPFLAKHTIGNIDMPIMYQGGTRDKDNTPLLRKTDGVYAQTHTNKYLVILDGADHFAWTEKNTTFHPSIISYSLAFFDYYLKGNASAGKILAEQLNDVSGLYYESRIGKTEPPKDATTPAAAKPASKHPTH